MIVYDKSNVEMREASFDAGYSSGENRPPSVEKKIQMGSCISHLAIDRRYTRPAGSRQFVKAMKDVKGVRG